MKINQILKYILQHQRPDCYIDTIISCCPQRWDISGGIPSFHIPPPQPPFTMAGGLGAPIPTKLKHKHKEKSSGVLGWVAGSKKRRQPAQQRADGSLGTRSQNSNYDENHGSARKLWGPTEDANRKRRSFLKHDPLNVHQMILKYLQGSVRPPITSVQEMANLVVGICVNVFDQYRVPDEYQFFEFFVSFIFCQKVDLLYPLLLNIYQLSPTN